MRQVWARASPSSMQRAGVEPGSSPPAPNTWISRPIRPTRTRFSRRWRFQTRHGESATRRRPRSRTMKLIERMREGVIISDGAMGTELQRAGLPLGESGEAWALDHPEVLQSIHEAYLAAGSDLILTNS